jgi:hypothetical protein
MRRSYKTLNYSLWRQPSSGCHGGSEKPALPPGVRCAPSRKAEGLSGDERAEGRVVCERSVLPTEVGVAQAFGCNAVFRDRRLPYEIGTTFPHAVSGFWLAVDGFWWTL